MNEAMETHILRLVNAVKKYDSVTADTNAVMLVLLNAYMQNGEEEKANIVRETIVKNENVFQEITESCSNILYDIAELEKEQVQELEKIMKHLEKE